MDGVDVMNRASGRSGLNDGARGSTDNRSGWSLFVLCIMQKREEGALNGIAQYCLRDFVNRRVEGRLDPRPKVTEH